VQVSIRIRILHRPVPPSASSGRDAPLQSEKQPFSTFNRLQNASYATTRGNLCGHVKSHKLLHSQEVCEAKCCLRLGPNVRHRGHLREVPASASEPPMHTGRQVRPSADKCAYKCAQAQLSAPKRRQVHPSADKCTQAQTCADKCFQARKSAPKCIHAHTSAHMHTHA
jgi:hypothetical protein